MRRYERRRRDRFDRELDRLADLEAGAWSSAGHESDLAPTARHLNDLHARQRATPDEQFVRRLEQRLMPRSSQPLAPPRWGATATVPHSHGRFNLGGSHRRMPFPLLASAVSTALLVALIGATAFLALRGGGPDRPQPTTIAAAAPDASPATARELLEPSGDTTGPLTAPEGERIGYGGMAVANDTVYRLLATTSFVGVEAVNAETDVVAWRLATDWSSAGILAGDAGVYFVSGASQLVAIDPASGGDLWQVSFSQPVVSAALQDPDVNDGVLYVWDESGSMTAVDTATGDVIWQKQTSDSGGPQSATEGQTMPGLTPVIGVDVVVMIGANGTLHAFDRASGEIVWSAPGFDGVHSRVVMNLETVFVLSGRGGSSNLTGTGIDLETGSVEWRIRVMGPLFQSAASEGTFFYVIGDSVTTESGVAIDPFYVDYGECCASWPGSEQPPAAAGTDGPGGSHLFGIDTTTGDVIWARSSKAGDFIALETRFPQSGNLAAVTADGHFVPIQRETGGIMPMPVQLGGPPTEFVLAGDRDFTTLLDGTLVPIDQFGEPA